MKIETRSVDEMLGELLAQISCARGAAASASDDQAGRAAVAALQATDQLNALAVGLLGRAGGVERATGLPAELVVRREARRVGWEARELCGASETLRQMPHTAEALVIGGRAADLGSAEPEQLIEEADDLCADLNPQREQRKQGHAIERSYLVLQGRFDGGGMMFGQADAEYFATICEAVDRSADRPRNADEVEAGSRGRQRMDALVGICEAHLAGDPDPQRARPRPRLYATMDIQALVDGSEGARLLAAYNGRPLRLAPLPTEVMSCDSEVIPVVCDNGQPIAVGQPVATVTDSLRRAVMARDGGCRFPGCNAPAAWSDVHHLERGVNKARKLVLLCRRCHWRVHHRGWTITIGDDDAITFDHRRRASISYPRGRPPPRP